MKSIFRNILALISGLVVGGIVNMGLIMISGFIIPPPEGADITTMEGLQESIHLFQPRHFLMPFLAHSLGTLVGALITAYVADASKTKWALAVGGVFLIGGITNLIALPSPLWFNIVDLVGAYIPMAYLGALLANKIQNKDL
ncbi:hypothetical protein [Gracilimonas sp.]|uniref:hypothetical protein n=1 Tax=Gracilimonas sp. TaxID=1974203 RepID=UPI002871D524|nr:hypothetical protein [Gracilimonas sp.]